VALPLVYNLRNVRVRWRVTALAVLGIALVVAVFAVLLSMSEGFRSALRSTGRKDNAVIVQRGVSSELMSQVSLEDRKTILTDDRIALGEGGQTLGSWESLSVIPLPRRVDGRRSNVALRVVPPIAFDVHGGIRIVAGRRFTPGLDEVIVGRRILERVRGLELDGAIRFRKRSLRIVGVFASEGAAFESEIWGDYDTLNSLLRRRDADASSLIVRMKDAAEIPAFDRWLRNQPGMSLVVLPEERYFENQAGYVSTSLRVLSAFVAVVMGTGAVFGAMNTMYAIVAVRTREIGTLRALGFSRRAILLSFMLESAALALVGGALGCLLALGLHGYSTGTANLQSLTEVAYAFRITPRIVTQALVLSVALGVLGGALPALRAAHLSIADAVRES
jgi:ABC-type antimicrobial peptide transport system permease subunit